MLCYWIFLYPPRADSRCCNFIKTQPDLQSIPVIIFSSSKAQRDIDKAYRLQANCYIPKPADFKGYLALMVSLIKFGVSCVQLPFPC